MDLSICDDWKLISGQASLTSLEDLKRVLSLPTEFHSYQVSIIFHSDNFAVLPIMVGSQCEPHFFFFLHITTILLPILAIITTLSSKRKRLKKELALTRRCSCLQFKPSFIRRDFVNGEQSTSTNVQLGWSFKMKPRNMSRKLIRSSNTDRQSQHLLKTFFFCKIVYLAAKWPFFLTAIFGAPWFELLYKREKEEQM